MASAVPRQTSWYRGPAGCDNDFARSGKSKRNPCGEEKVVLVEKMIEENWESRQGNEKVR